MVDLLKKAKLNPLDLAIIFILLLSGAVLYQKFNIDYGHKWNWGNIFQYIVNKDSSGTINLGSISKGFLVTIKLSVWSMIFASIIGVFVGVLRSSENIFIKILSKIYVELTRNIPTIVLIFIFYFFIGDKIMLALSVEDYIYNLSPWMKGIFEILFVEQHLLIPFFSALLTMAVLEGAYITEIIYTGLKGIPKQQWEVSKSLGFNYLQQIRLVILPQVFRKVLPPLGGQFISTIKDSAIVSVISIQELTFQGMELVSSTYMIFEVWIVITLLYFILTFSCSMIFKKLEDKYLLVLK